MLLVNMFSFSFMPTVDQLVENPSLWDFAFVYLYNKIQRCENALEMPSVGCQVRDVHKNESAAYAEVRLAIFRLECKQF
jgi:hypothetical protein